MYKKTRWQQGFENFEKAFIQLKEGCIQRFEYTFELAWKTLKDYLESMDIKALFPCDVIKKSFYYKLIDNGDVWIDMLAKRNLLSHTYDKEAAEKAFSYIADYFFNALEQFYNHLKSK